MKIVAVFEMVMLLMAGCAVWALARERIKDIRKVKAIREAALPLAVRAYGAIEAYEKSDIGQVEFLRKERRDINIMVAAPISQWRELIRIVKGET